MARTRYEHFYADTVEMRLVGSGRGGDDLATMSALIDAEIRVWIKCRRCGRFDKSVVPIRLPEELAYSATEKVCMSCERCQGHALMYLQRAVRRVH